LNRPEIRHTAIEQFSKRLTNSVPDESSFVDYFNFVTHADFMTSSGDIQVATVEFDEVWESHQIYEPYESLLVFYMNAGLVPRRLFLVDIGELRDPMYRTRFGKVVFRHELLKLRPRIAFLQDAQRELYRSVGIACDAFGVIRLDYALLIQLKPMTWAQSLWHESLMDEPAMLKTTNRLICTEISNILTTMWNNSQIDFGTFERMFGALEKSHKVDSENEARYISELAKARKLSL